MRIEDWIMRDALDRQARLKEINRPNYDPAIHAADFGANVFVLVMLIAGIVYILMR